MNLTIEEMTTLPTMTLIALSLSLFWYLTLELSQTTLSQSLSNPKLCPWWPRAIAPTTSMMQNFGFPKQPTPKFPEGVTEPMARDFYSWLLAICFQHFISGVGMIPVVVYGWEGSGEWMKVAFVMGTLSDFGYDIYDAVMTTIRTFGNHSKPIPFDFWMVIVALHHTTSLCLVLPLNMKYVHREEFHQIALSLLMAASLCYAAGCYKFALNALSNYRDFLIYKSIVLLQFAIIIYTRVYLWFPSAFSLRAHFRDQNDTPYFYIATLMTVIFSVFNMLLVADALKAVVKWIPKKFPKTKEERRKSEIDFVAAAAELSALDAPGFSSPAEIVRRMRARRKFKGVVHHVIAANRLKSQSSGKDE